MSIHFTSTTYVGQVMAAELGHEPDNDVATRTGEFAMAIYSVSKYHICSSQKEITKAPQLLFLLERCSPA